MAEQPAAKEAASKPKSRLPMTLGLVLGVAIAEAVVFFLVFKMGGGGPQTAEASETHAIEEAPASQPVGYAEVAVLRGFRVPNDKSGRMYIYDIDVTVVVPTDHKERVETLVKERSGEIGDCMARIMRGATDRMLKEDDLRALRQQMLEGLHLIAEDESLVQRVLIPRFVPIRGD